MSQALRRTVAHQFHLAISSAPIIPAARLFDETLDYGINDTCRRAQAVPPRVELPVALGPHGAQGYSSKWEDNTCILCCFFLDIQYEVLHNAFIKISF